MQCYFGKQSYLFAGCRNKQITPDLLHQELCWDKVACEGSCSHEQAPALPLATCEQTERHFKQNKNQHHLPRGANMSDNNWNFVDEVLNFNAAGLIYTRGIWTEVTPGKQSYEERSRFYTTSSSQEATEPPSLSLAKLYKRKGGRGKADGLCSQYLCMDWPWATPALQVSHPGGYTTLLCQHLGHPHAQTKTLGSGI